jgi:uncharacterized protein YdhG (YjbR/CyaY superfamily)
VTRQKQLSLIGCLDVPSHTTKVRWPASESVEEQTALPTKPKSIDRYLATIGRHRRAQLEELRLLIRRVVPAAEECISYGMPAFRVDGGVLAGFAATKAGCSYYPFSGRTLSDLASELGGYRRTKSALHLSAEQPLPVRLLRKLLGARLAEIRGKGAAHVGEASRMRAARTSRSAMPHRGRGSC